MQKEQQEEYLPVGKQQTTDRTLMEKYIKEGHHDPKFDYNQRDNRENILKKIRFSNMA